MALKPVNTMKAVWTYFVTLEDNYLQELHFHSWLKSLEIISYPYIGILNGHHIHLMSTPNISFYELFIQHLHKTRVL